MPLLSASQRYVVSVTRWSVGALRYFAENRRATASASAGAAARSDIRQSAAGCGCGIRGLLRAAGWTLCVADRVARIGDLSVLFVRSF
jgi:hypothetical protein